MTDTLIQIPFTLTREELTGVSTYHGLLELVNQKLAGIAETVLSALQARMSITIELPPAPVEPLTADEEA